MTTAERSTGLGRIRGVQRLGVTTYFGVPFAEPAQRFKPPVPSGPWAGTFDATTPGNRPMQAAENAVHERIFGPAAPGARSEDCLYLNVHVPDTPSRALRPVLFWIYGGGFGGGSANQYDGTALAMTADAVVVVVNYRLGMFALADVRPLGGEYKGSPNLWHSDQLAALRWVHANIADFGGDPDRITVLGESAGATSVLALLASPEARPLIHGGVSCSPAFLATAPPDNEAIATALGIPVDEVPGYLLSAPPDELLEISSRTVLQAWVDGEVIPRQPHEVIAALQSGAVPLVAGFAPHEGQFMNTDMTAQGLPPAVIGMVAHGVAVLNAGTADAVPGYLARLADHHQHRDELELSDLVWTDLFRRSSIDAVSATAGAGAGAWHYSFDVPCTVDGKPLQSTHCVDLPFTFNWFADPEHRMGDWVVFNEPNQSLSRRWVAALTAFARTGDPSGPIGEWPSYDEASRSTLVVTNEGTSVVSDIDSEYRTAIWTATDTTLLS